MFSPALPKLRLLRAVAMTAHLGQTRAAAAAIHLTQPAVTQAIARLEALLETPLFTRSATGVYPTDCGVRLVARIDRAFDHLAAAERLMLTDTRRPPGWLRDVLTLVQARAFVQTARAGSLTLAAQALGVSQPSINRAVRDLELLLGRPLFDRTPRGMEATREARALARPIALALTEIEQGLQEVREDRGVMDGAVVIGCLPLARTRILPDAVLALLAEFPEARIRIVDGAYADLLDDLRHGGVDLILGALRHPAPSPEIEQEELFREPLSIVVRSGHPILTVPTPTPADLAALDWIVAAPGVPARQQFEQFFVRAGLTVPARRIECGSLIATRALIVNSDRAVLLSASQVSHDVATGHLAVLPAPLPETERAIGLATRRGWQPTRLQAALMGCIRAAATEAMIS